MALPKGEIADDKPLIIGVMGGSYNPIHLGHVLLAIGAKETKPVDKVVMVPVFKHPAKTDLLPFEHRVAMCRLAVQSSNVEVSTVEEETGESNAVMLRALRRKYPEGTKLLWICGDDVFEWIENARGQEMMAELAGLIVQRRLHRMNSDESNADQFFKAPVDDRHIQRISVKFGLEIDFIYGELPHFSSTLVRQSPASWRAFLPARVAAYLDSHPDLLAKLTAPKPKARDPVAEPPMKQPRIEMEVRRQDSQIEIVTASLMNCLGVIHALQRERGAAALALSMGHGIGTEKLKAARESVDDFLSQVPVLPPSTGEARDMAEELAYVPTWLGRDRAVLDRHLATQDQPGTASTSGWVKLPGGQAWLARASLVKKFHARIEVLLSGCTRALRTLMMLAAHGDHSHFDSTKLFYTSAETEKLYSLFCCWAKMKEALGRERGFICCGGADAITAVQDSLAVRTSLTDLIQEKEQLVQRTLDLQTQVVGVAAATGKSLHKMLSCVTALEWALMGCFAPSTPLTVVHRMLSREGEVRPFLDRSAEGCKFDVLQFHESASKAIDLMLSVMQALAAHICANSAKASGQASGPASGEAEPSTP
mmetsp:Transcript_92198/g.269780  ORF Transcript_92198/g.269780 Transcript_92198/m.269780 type:complete len:594 (+) Transcript_92198:138-1919(+)